MNKDDMTITIIEAKKKSGMGWEDIAEKVGLNPVFLTSACLGMNSLKPEYAEKLCEVLSLTDDTSVALQEFPHKSWDKIVPTDPVIYRFYEMVGDGIMSAIDFSMDIGKEENPAGDRVVINLNGKFLPYKSW